MTQTAEATSLAASIAKVSNVIISSTKETFETMLDMQVERKFVKVVDRNKPLLGITSVISLSGDLYGTLCLSMTRGTVLRLANRMMGMEFEEVDELVSSCVSEFANVIAGSSKVALTDMNLNLGLPTLIRGSDYQIDFPSLSQPLCVSYHCELGPFLLVFGFAQR
ncbi:MAG: chemotaxis protein CheX [Planctomycetaceae bacterium]|nr:chemotaxis protein CheX [Planctomycetaceae bacterium]